MSIARPGWRQIAGSTRRPVDTAHWAATAAPPKLSSESAMSALQPPHEKNGFLEPTSNLSAPCPWCRLVPPLLTCATELPQLLRTGGVEQSKQVDRQPRATSVVLEPTLPIGSGADWCHGILAGPPRRHLVGEQDANRSRTSPKRSQPSEPRNGRVPNAFL
jgi:hypothetical protein